MRRAARPCVHRGGYQRRDVEQGDVEEHHVSNIPEVDGRYVEHHACEQHGGVEEHDAVQYHVSNIHVRLERCVELNACE